MKTCCFLLLTIVICFIVGGYGTVVVSHECAAVLFTLGAGWGESLYAHIPKAFCTAEYCPPGVSSRSFASWWESALPMVAKSDAFAQLRALALGNTGSQSLTISDENFGSFVTALNIRQFCKYVDEVDSGTAVGRAIHRDATLGSEAARLTLFDSLCSSSETSTVATKSVTTANGWVEESAAEEEETNVMFQPDFQEFSQELNAAKEQVVKACAESEECLAAIQATKEFGAAAAKLGSSASKLVSKIIDEFFSD